MGFSFRDGYLTCDDIRIKDIQEKIGHSPFYLYSAKQIRENYAAYASALDSIPSVIAYSVKANGNVRLLSILEALRSWATLVSGNELRLSLAAGFDAKRLILNGNGKTREELTLAVKNGVMINVDSAFDLEHIAEVSQACGRTADVLLRINPGIDPAVHPYVSTGLRDSKFGVNRERIDGMLQRFKRAPSINLTGVHCHLGSMIERLGVFKEAMALIAGHFDRLKAQDFPVKYVNLGGGLGIDYTRRADSFPTPGDLIASIRDLLPGDATLIVEPGRSIMGNAGILVARVIGVKDAGEKRFIVIDASMAELIRPSIYGAYHEIAFIEPVGGEKKRFDVVGPICESGDFLGKSRELPTPPEGAGIVIYDTGAYGFAMSSNYNARMRPPEYLVDHGVLTQIRRAESFDDYMRQFETGRM